MSEQKGMVTAIVISFLILFGFNYFFDSKKATEIEQNAEQISTYVNNVKSENIDHKKLPRNESLNQSKRINIETPKLKGSINLIGAKIDDLSLLKYKETTDENSGFVTLLNPENTEKPYYVKTYWVNAEKDSNVVMPDENTVWNISGDQNQVLSPNNSIKLIWASPQGIIFERTISIDNRYMISSVDKVINKSGTDLKISQRSEIIRTINKKTRLSTSVHEGVVGYFDNEMKEVSFDKLIKGDVVNGKISDGWIGFTDKYWLTSFVIKDLNPAQVNVEKISDELIRCQIDSAIMLLKQNESIEYKNLLFSGAKVLKYLDSYSSSHGVKNFDLAVDFGWFYFLTKPLFYLLQFFNSLLGNLALAIIILTILSKVVLFPFAKTSYHSMARMKDLQPKIDDLKKRYGNDKMKVNEELMKIYKKEKINPASGCLPLLVQMPIFFCLYKVFAISIEMRHAPMMLWIKDLSAPDPTSLFNLFGLISWDPPSLLQIGVLPLIMGATMILQQKLSPQPADPTQAKMMYLMPLIFLFMFSAFPAGLVLYWTVSNILSIIQQYFIKSPKLKKKHA